MSHVDFAVIASVISNAFHGFAQWAAPAAVTALWQGVAVAAGLAVCLRLAPRVAATHRFVAWAAGFCVAVGLPALPFMMRMLVSGSTEGLPAAAGGATHVWFEPLIKIDTRWSLAIAGLWLMLLAYRAVDLAIHSLRLRGLWKSAKPVDDEALFSLAAGRLAGRTVEICTTGELDRPSVIGFLAPRILIPEWLLQKLTREELEQVILHEAEHLRRRDDWTNLAQKLCLVAFPLNPALQWMERRLSKEREMACDEGVVRVTGAPRAYAACLASLAERGLEHNLANRMARDFARRAEALSLGAFERRPELVHRVHSILGGRMLSPVAGRALVGVVSCGLLFGSVELARCPQMVAFVQEPDAAPVTAMAVPSAAPHMVRAGYAVARANEGFRAVNAVAMVPVRAHEPAMARMDQEHGDAVRSLKTAVSGAAIAQPHEVLLKAPVRTAAAKQTAQPQEWLVVTTWQVQTTFRAQNVADYDDGAAKATDAAQDRSAKTRPVAGMAVTRMFLGVYRASQTAQAASRNSGDAANKTARSTATNTDLKSFSSQPAGRPWGAVPFGDGWLVIQL
jgi:beta-lactamase regulating signal transducer with metallopeptidase domain